VTGRTGYVARIREKIGTDLLMLHAVSIFVFDAQGHFLMAEQRGDDHWLTIGGAVEVDETPADAAVREFWEETGALVRPTRVLGVFGGPDFRITYANGDQVAYTTVAFEAELLSGTPTPDGAELTKLAWIDPAQLASLKMRDGMRKLVSLSLRGRDTPGFEPGVWQPQTD
jgi:8-oxo-dGTP pyrophosphatase MutT (NUDIX family)